MVISPHFRGYLRQFGRRVKSVIKRRRPSVDLEPNKQHSSIFRRHSTFNKSDNSEDLVTKNFNKENSVDLVTNNFENENSVDLVTNNFSKENSVDLVTNNFSKENSVDLVTNNFEKENSVDLVSKNWTTSM